MVHDIPDKAVYMLELRRHGDYRVETDGLTAPPVQCMGGLRVLPSKTVSDVDPGDVEFARELFEELYVRSPEDRIAWTTIFRSARLPATDA